MSKWRTSAWLAVWRGRENLSRTSGGCLAWIIRVRRRQRGKAGDPCHGPWALVEPRDNAVDIDGGCRGHVLHVGLGYTPIPCASEAKGAHSLRERPFDAGPALRTAGLPRWQTRSAPLPAPHTAPGAAVAAVDPCAWPEYKRSAR